MTPREKLRLLAEIDMMIALRDAARQRNTQKGRYVAYLMEGTIEMARQRLRGLSKRAAVAESQRFAA